MKLFLSIVICLSAGFIGSVFTTPAIPVWYASLNKPFFNPPSWVFAPVWTTLYILMGVSLSYFWTKKGLAARKWFFIQLGLNTFWSIAFFGIKNPFLGLIVIVALIISIVKTIQLAQKVNTSAAKLLYPYLAWVSFASFLNFSIVVLN